MVQAVQVQVLFAAMKKGSSEMKNLFNFNEKYLRSRKQDLNRSERSEKLRAVRSNFSDSLPWRATKANAAAAEGSDRRSLTGAASPVRRNNKTQHLNKPRCQLYVVARCCCFKQKSQNLVTFGTQPAIFLLY